MRTISVRATAKSGLAVAVLAGWTKSPRTTFRSRHDSGIGSANLRVLEEGLHARQVGLRVSVAGAGHGFVGLGLGHVRLALHQGGLGRLDLRAGLVRAPPRRP